MFLGTATKAFWQVDVPHKWGDLYIGVFQDDESEKCINGKNTNKETMSTETHLSIMKNIEMKIHEQLAKLDILETDASLRSYLLYPFRVFIRETKETVELYGNLAGEYRKVMGEIRNGRPVWKHIEHTLELECSDSRWRIVDSSDNTIIARSEITMRNMLTDSDQWEYFNDNNWHTINEKLLNLFPEYQIDSQGKLFSFELFSIFHHLFSAVDNWWLGWRQTVLS